MGFTEGLLDFLRNECSVEMGKIGHDKEDKLKTQKVKSRHQNVGEMEYGGS